MRNLTFITALLVCALSGLALAGGAAAADIGVTDDGGKYAAGGPDAFYSRMASLGLDENVMTVHFDPDNPTGIDNEAQVAAAVDAAQAHGVRLVFAVGTGRARTITSNPLATAQYLAYLQLLLTRFPTVTTYIVGNEPNQTRFWQPQFTTACRQVSGWAYERLLAQAYDTIKAANPAIRVLGLGLSPRGNDDCHARNNVSSSPVHFLAGMGAAYRASDRTTPIMDGLSFHPYPRFNRDPIARGYAYPNAGVPNLGRIKQAFWDAFAGTGQPTFAEGAAPPAPIATADTPPADAPPPPPQFSLDEVGWQAKEPAAHRKAYHGRENVPLVSESQQAAIYSQLVHVANCDPNVASLNYFHLDDESDRDRFQSGLFRADQSARPAALGVAGAISRDAGTCSGTPAAWRHTTSVVGASARFGVRRGVLGFTVGAAEEASFAAGVFRASEASNRSAIDRVLSVRAAAHETVFTAKGSLRAYWKRTIHVSARLRPGSYVIGVRLSARFNPGRSTLLLSAPYAVR